MRLGPSRRLIARLAPRERQRPGAPPPGGRKPQRATPPNVSGQGPLIAAPGLHLGIVVIVRNEAPYLEEWLAFHLALGVEHVFLYDNGSDDELHAVIERHQNHGLLTLVHWPLPGGQLDAYSHALRFFGPSVDWLAFIDVDEFIVPQVDEDIPSFLARFPDAADIRVPRVDFGFSGHRSPPEGLTIAAYTGVANVFGRDPEQAPRVKTIVQPRGVSAVGIHTATLADVPVSRDGGPVPTRSVRQGARGLAQVNHYYTRSFEEFEAKRFRGSATGRLPRPGLPFDLPIEREDRSAERFVPHTRAMIERLRTLEPRPYRYGSQLALDQFPRSNDLGLFAEFMLANVAAGATELLREPAMRLPNLYAGIGFLGDLGATGLRARRGALSGSIHLPPLLEHVRGRLEAVLGRPGESGAARAGGWTVEGGVLVEHDGDAWRPTSPAGEPGEGPVELLARPADDGMRRCYAVGFLVRTAQAARLELRLQAADRAAVDGDAVAAAEDPPPAPLDLTLEGPSTYAGLVELDPRPLFASAIRVRLPAGRGLELLDLFVVSYG